MQLFFGDCESDFSISSFQETTPSLVVSFIRDSGLLAAESGASDKLEV